MTEPIRVLQVMASLDRGGAETVVMDWLRRIDRTKVTFDFVVNEGGPYAFEEEAIGLGSRIVRAPVFQGWNALGYATWWRNLLTKHPEWQIVHAHHTTPAFIFLAVARRLGRRTIAHSHTGGRDASLKGAARTALSWPLRFVAQTHLACSTLAGTWMFGRRTPARVIPNGITAERFAYSLANRERTRRELGLQDALVVGHVGSFSKPKNHARLLRVFSALVKREQRARLLLVGDGGLRDQIEQDIRSFDLEDKVLLVGVRRDIPELLSAMDVLLFPSHYEGLPVAVVEAQATGLPCVVSDSVTPEVALTDLVSFLSLGQSDNVWAQEVAETSTRLVARSSRTQEIRSAGYGAAEVAEEITDLYQSVHQRFSERA